MSPSMHGKLVFFWSCDLVFSIRIKTPVYYLTITKLDLAYVIFQSKATPWR